MNQDPNFKRFGSTEEERSPKGLLNYKKMKWIPNKAKPMRMKGLRDYDKDGILNHFDKYPHKKKPWGKWIPRQSQMIRKPGWMRYKK